MPAIGFNLQRLIHVKPRLKQRTFQTKHVKLCRELLNRGHKLLSFHEKLPSLRKKLPCFAENTSAHPQTYLDLVRAHHARAKSRLP
jgi:hypothetical protein